MNSNSKIKARNEKMEYIIGTGVNNKNSFYDALKEYIEAKKALAGWNETLRLCAKNAAKVCKMLGDYAISHKSVFDGTDEDGAFAEIRNGVFNGDVPLDDEIYHLSVSRGEAKRLDGANMTQAFLEKLPSDWVKNTLVKVDKAINAATDEELAEHGLECANKYTWTMK